MIRVTLCFTLLVLFLLVVGPTSVMSEPGVIVWGDDTFWTSTDGINFYNSNVSTGGFRAIDAMHYSAAQNLWVGVGWADTDLHRASIRWSTDGLYWKNGTGPGLFDKFGRSIVYIENSDVWWVGGHMLTERYDDLPHSLAFSYDGKHWKKAAIGYGHGEPLWGYDVAYSVSQDVFAFSWYGYTPDGPFTAISYIDNQKLDPEAFDIAPFDQSQMPNDDDVYYLYEAGGIWSVPSSVFVSVTYRSTDLETWNLVPVQFQKMAYSASQALWVSHNDTNFITSTNGITWTKGPESTFDKGSVTRIFFSSEVGRWISTAKKDGAHVVLSSSDGVEWNVVTHKSYYGASGNVAYFGPSTTTSAPTTTQSQNKNPDGDTTVDDPSEEVSEDSDSTSDGNAPAFLLIALFSFVIRMIC